MSDTMHDVTETLTVELDSSPATDQVDQADLQQACVTLSEHQGINSAYVKELVNLVIEFQPFVISEEAVYDRVRDARLPIRREPPPKTGILRRFINRLAEDNRQSFGSTQLDCCDLNKNNRPGR